MFPVVAVPTYILTNSYRFPTSSPALVISCPFDKKCLRSHFNGYELVSRSFHLHFPDDQWCGTPFHIPVGHLYVFEEKCLMFLPLVGNARMWEAGLIYTQVFHCAGGGTSNPFVAQGSAVFRSSGHCLIRLFGALFLLLSFMRFFFTYFVY